MLEKVVQIKHDKFKDDSKEKMESTLSNFDGTYDEVLKEVLYELLEHGLKNEKKKNQYEFERKDVDDIVDFIQEQIHNEVKCLSGKEKQVTFGTLSWQIAHYLCARSQSNYRMHKKISPLHYPLMSSIQKAYAENKVSDGRGTQVYENRLATKVANEQYTEYCYAMCDEVDTKEGVKYHSSTGATPGLENDMLDVSSALHRLLLNDHGKVEKAQKANQWLILTFGTKKFQSWKGKFFFNNGSLTGKTLLNQFINIILSCKAIVSQVLGLVLDAGGNNSNFISMLRDTK